jgi:hypothetical protein
VTDAVVPDEYTGITGTSPAYPWVVYGDDKYELIHDYVWTEDDE